MGGEGRGVNGMKRLKLYAALLLMLAALLTPLCALAQTALVDSDGALNMRERPSRDSDSLGGFYSGTQVEIVSDAGEGWSEVSIGRGGNVSGYMMNDYLATGEQMSGVRDRTYDGQVVSPYGTQSIVLRDAPSDSYGAVAMLPVGESVRVIGESGGFYYVRTGDDSVGCLASDEVN